MSKLLIIAGLFLLILPFFVLGDPPSATMLELDREGFVVFPDEPSQAATANHGQQPGSEEQGGNSQSSPGQAEQTITHTQRVVVKPKRSVRFRAVDDDTNAPIARYHLRIFAVGERTSRLFHEAKVNTPDRIEFPLPDGNLDGWVLDIRSPGYAAFQHDLDGCIDEDDEDDNEAWMSKGTSFVGRILDPEGLPVGGMEVDSDHCDSCWTDPRGEFALSLPASETHVKEVYLAAEKTDVGGLEFEFKIADYAHRPLPDLRLRGGGVLQGRLVLLDGTPLRDFLVGAQHVDDDEDPPPPPGIANATASTDAQGFFRMSGLAQGRYELWVDLADVDGRSLEYSSSLTLSPGLQTGRTRTWRFQLLDVQVSLPKRFRKCVIEANVQSPSKETEQTLRWKATASAGVRSLPFLEGTRLTIDATIAKKSWVHQRVKMLRGRLRQRVHIQLPDPESWVPLSVEIQAPALIRHRRVGVEVLDANKKWRTLIAKENKPGLFEFRMPPGEQRIEISLKARVALMRCGNGIPPRHSRGEIIPFIAWLPERRTVQALPGGSIHISWRPRREASMTFLFEAPNASAAAQPLQEVKVTRLDPDDPKRRRVLDRNSTLASQYWGRAVWYGPRIPPGRHLFRFEAKGYAPVCHEVWLKARQDRLLRIRLEPWTPPSIDELMEPYRCGRAQRK